MAVPRARATTHSRRAFRIQARGGDSGERHASIKVDLDWAQRIKQATGAFLLMTGHHVGHMQDGLDHFRSWTRSAAASGSHSTGGVHSAARRRWPCRRAGLDPQGGQWIGDRGAATTQRGGSGCAAVSPPRHPGHEAVSRQPGRHSDTLLAAAFLAGLSYQCNFCVWPRSCTTTQVPHPFRQDVVDEIRVGVPDPETVDLSLLLL